MSSVTEQVKKYRNRFKIRDSERVPYLAAPRNPFSFCFDNSIDVWFSYVDCDLVILDLR